MFSQYISTELRDEIINVFETTKAESWHQLHRLYQIQLTCLYLKEYYRREGDACGVLDFIQSDDLVGLFLNMIEGGSQNSDKSFDFIHAAGKAMTKENSNAMEAIYHEVWSDIVNNPANPFED